MRILEKTISVLLVICMMFTLLPTEIMQDILVDVNAEVQGGSKPIANYPAKLGTAGGALTINNVSFRVSLSRQPETYLNGTQKAKDKVVGAHSYKYPTLSKAAQVAQDTLFFIPSEVYSYFDKNHNGSYVYYPNNASQGLQKSTGEGVKCLFIERKWQSNIPKNTFKDKVIAAKNAKTIVSTSDLTRNAWTNYLPSVSEARALMNYVLSITLEKSSPDINQRIVNVVDKNFNKNRDDLGPEEQFNVAVGYAGFLASLYVIAKDSGADAVMGAYEQAINDYFANNNTKEKPVTVVIDTCMTYTEANGSYGIAPSIDLIEFILATNTEYSITPGDAFLRTLAKNDGHSNGYNTKEMVTAMAQASMNNYPWGTTKGYTNGSKKADEKVILRTADIKSVGASWGNTLNNTAIGWAIRVFQFSDGTIWTTSSGPGWGNGKWGYMSLLYLTDLIDGFVLVGNHMSNPYPTANYAVKDEIQLTEDTCEDIVYIETPILINMNICKNSEYLSYLEGFKDSDKTIKLESRVNRYIMEGSTDTAKAIETNLGGFASDGGVIDPVSKMLQDTIDGEYTIEQFIQLASDVFTIEDVELMDHSAHFFERPDTYKLLIFRYQIDLRLTFGELVYDLKFKDIIERNGGVPLDCATFKIMGKYQPEDGPEDIEITKPSSPDTTEIINPSENENLSVNNIMKTQYEYMSMLPQEVDGVVNIGSVSSFAEVKNNKPLNEEYEVMGGVPSTEELYLSFGGTEFKVATGVHYWINEHSRDRTYTIHFENNLCEYNNQEKGKGDSWEGIDLPQAAGASQTTTRFEHATSSSVDYADNSNSKKYGTLTVTASWSGSIPNNASTVSVDGVGTAHADCPAEPDISQYTEAISQANEWLSAMAALSIEWTAASDKELRKVTVPSLTLDQSNSGSTDESGGASDSGNDGSFMTATASATFSNPVTTTGDASASHTESCGEDCSYEVPDPCTAVAAPSGAGSYSITITFTIVPHAVCGPCCEHVLPDLYDTWRQGLVFDYAKINQIRLYTLERGAADGFKEITGTDRIHATVVSGNPTYFMNVAGLTEQDKSFPVSDFYSANPDTLPNFDENWVKQGRTLDLQGTNHFKVINDRKRQYAQTSRAGRLRYILDPTYQKNDTFTFTEQGNGIGGEFVVDYEKVANSKQHDDVIYTIGKRSMNCDGMATTNNFGKSSSNNVKPMETTGHNNEWADGCLYTNILNTSDYSNYWKDGSLGYTYVPKELLENDKNITKYYEDYNHHVVRDGGSDKSGYSDKADTKDTETAEWKVFNASRRTRIIVDVISDFLIMQTSGGDQSIFYFEKASIPTEAQEHFQKVKADEEEMFTENPLSIWNARTMDPCEPDDATMSTIKGGILGFEIIGGYNGRYDRPMDKYKPYSLITKKFLSFGGKDGENWQKYYTSYDKGTFQTKVGGNYDPYGETKIVTIFDDDPAGTINRPERQAINQETSFKLYQDKIQILPTAPNRKYDFQDAVIWYSQQVAFWSSGLKTVGLLGIGWPQIHAYGDAYKERWGEASGVQFTCKYYLDGDGAANTNTINSVVVYSPVSTEYAMVVPQGDLTVETANSGLYTVSRDQRVNTFDFPKMNDILNNLKVCPLDPATCEFRYLDCKYLKNQDLAFFDFSNATRDEDTGYWKVVNTTTGVEYLLPPDYQIQSGGFGTGNYLNAQGKTAWSIPFNELGISNSNSTRLRLEMDLKVNANSGQIMVAGFRNLGFILDLNKGNTGSFIKANTQLKRVETSKTLQTPLTNVHVSIVFSFNNITDCRVYLNNDYVNAVPVKVIQDYRNTWTNIKTGEKDELGNDITKRGQVKTDVIIGQNYNDSDDKTSLDNRPLEVRTNPPSNLKSSDIMSSLNIGTWSNASSTYQANYYIDNLKITLLGGTHTHNSSCYTTHTIHSTKRVHVHDENCYLKEDTYMCDGELNANYQLDCNKTGLIEHCTGILNTGGYSRTLYVYYHSSGCTYSGSTHYSTSPNGCSCDHASCVSRYSSTTTLPRGYVTFLHSNRESMHISSTYDKCSVCGRTGTVTISSNYTSHTHTSDCYHKHSGTPGLDYPNGCYTKPTAHKHSTGSVVAGQTYNFTYTGNSQSINLPAGQYKLEVWGAQGGNDTSNPTQYLGGRGGYSTGILTLDNNTTLYVYVGSQGTGNANSGSWGSTGGGGATDIRYIGGTWNNSSSLYSRILVAGGGGGRHGKNYETINGSGSLRYVGNDAAGLNSYTMTLNNTTITSPSVSGGGSSNYSTSVYPGYFGYAKQDGTGQGNVSSRGGYNGGGNGSDNWANGGPGGGWYGGTSSWPNSTGGSGYALTTNSYKPSGYNPSSKYYLKDTSVLAGNQSFVSPNGGTETGHSGNGYARITALTTISTCEMLPKGSFVCTGILNTTTDNNVHVHNSSCLTDYTELTPYNFTYTGRGQSFTVPYTDYYKVEVYSAGGNSGSASYVSGIIKLKADRKLYIYIGGSDGYNDGDSDIRTIGEVSNPIDTMGLAGNDDSLNSRLFISKRTETSTDKSRVVSRLGLEITNAEITKKGGSKNGRVIITPLNRLPLSDKTMLDAIADGEIPEIEVIKYIGEDLANTIMTTPVVFETLDNFGWMKPNSVIGADNNLYFENNNIISDIRGSGYEFYIPVNMQAKILRQIRITLNNNTASTKIGVAINNKEKAVYTTQSARAQNQVITIDVTKDWINSTINKIYFDIAEGSSTGTTVVKKIEFIGFASKGSNSYNLSNLLTLNNFTSNDTKGFVNANNTSISQSSNKMIVTATGNDPQVTWTTLDKMQAEAVRFIKLVVTNKTNRAEFGQLFYSVNNDYLREAWSYQWPLANIAGTQTIWIDTLSHTAYNETTNTLTRYGTVGTWTGNITGLRFDWISGNNGSVEVSEISFIGQGNRTGTGGIINSTGESWTFNYTNGVQSKTLNPGKYKLEVWGAEGGKSSHGIQGGLGGYAYGELNIDTSKNVYIYVGGMGTSSTGGFNGGGNGSTTNNDSAGGGGATDIRLDGTSLNNRIIVAGGGGASGCSNTYGGAGGGLNGGNPTDPNTSYSPGSGATQYSGGVAGVNSQNGSFGKGGDSGLSQAWPGGGGGGGWYGGGAGGNTSGGGGAGGGGSGYIGGVTNGNMSSGVKSGNGKAVITSLQSVSKVNITSNGTHILTATYDNPIQSDVVRQTILDNIDKLPKYVDGDYNPIFACKFQGFNEHSCVNCKTYTSLTCKDPHHKGSTITTYTDEDGNVVEHIEFLEHYSGANKICWSACGDDSNHRITPTEVYDETNQKVIPLAEYLQIDEGFTIYFPNRGNFKGNDALGLSKCQLTRGKGYKDYMDTTKWTREKRVKFPFDVLYQEDDGRIQLYMAYSWIELKVDQDYYNFYILGENPEVANAGVEFEVEAINCGTNSGLAPMYGIPYSDSIGTSYDEALAKYLEEYAKEFLDIMSGKTYSKVGYLRLLANPKGENNNAGAGHRTSLINEGIMRVFDGLHKKQERELSGIIKKNNTQINRDFKEINEKVKLPTMNDNRIRLDNKMRTDSFQSLHGGYKHFYLDVIGRIGNFSITDTEDFRFSNFFKMPVASPGTEAYKDPNNWLVEGIILKVDNDVQNYYVGDTYDIRGYKASVNNRWLDTYGTQSWMAGKLTATGERDINTPNLVSQILTGEVNNIDILKEEELRYGYDAYTSIVTLGSYHNGMVEVVPKYYAIKVTDRELTNVPSQYNKLKGEMIPVDIYVNKEGVYAPVNVFDNAGQGIPNKGNLPLSDYTFNLNWDTESGRRNYTLEEKARTERVKEKFKEIIYDVSEYEEGESFENENLPILDIIEYVTPSGKDNFLGTSQYILMNSTHRTFIGSINTHGNSKNGHTIWNGTDFLVDKRNYPNAYEVDNLESIPEVDFERAVQRWHGKLGLPSSSVYVPHGEDVNGKTIEYLMGENVDDWEIICTAEVIAVGAVWSLAYSQPWFDTMTINGEPYRTSAHYPGHRIYKDGESIPCPDCIGPIIAIFSQSSVDDVEIVDIY